MSLFKKIKNSKSFSIFSSHSTVNGSYNSRKTFDTTIYSIQNTNTLDSTFSNGSPNKFEASHTRTLVIYHIDSETEGTFSLTIKDDDLGEIVIDRVCDHFSLTDYKEYFGLKFTLVDSKGDYEIFWLDPLKKVGKQLKNTNNMLTFRVKHFPGKPELIESEYVRYLIFLQIRNYLLKGDLQLSLVDETQLAAYAVQAFIGDYDEELHCDNYLGEIQFLSQKTIKAEESIREYHKQLKGKTPAEMELAFLEKASKFDTYGAELIVVKNSKNVLINFGVSHNGLITFLHGHSPNLAKICLYPWTQIGKITYEGKKLQVHAFTPDNNNSEVIKKHLMTFKCNNERICKHLWKFILDQKAFFNFKKGVDVPRVKSSSSLFHHKSKFRFSGRCESELIASQSQSFRSRNLDTPNSSLNTTQNSNSFERSATLQNPSTFKRRTFISAYRPKSKRFSDQNTSPSDNEQNKRNSDSNNNNLKQIENLNISQASSNGNKQAQGSSETASTNTQQTVIIKPDSTEETIEGVSQEPSFTSTPHTTSRHMFKIQDLNKPSEEARNSILAEDEDEIFYDHDEILSSEMSSNLSTPNGKLIPTNFENKNHKSYLQILVLLTCFSFITYWFFFSNSSSSSLINRLTNNVFFIAQSIKSKLAGFWNSDYGRNSINPRWVQWPVFTNSTLDPLITWFLSKYQPNL